MEIQKVQEKTIRIFEKWKESSKFRKVQKKQKNHKTKKTFIKQKLSNIRNKTDKLTK